MKHWAHFPAFKSVRGSLKRPGLTMPDDGARCRRGPGEGGGGGTVFMRWKERFLVPDHKTKEISGARYVLSSFFALGESSWTDHVIHLSFAGFYYVAVTEATEDSPASITAFYFHPQSEP